MATTEVTFLGRAALPGGGPGTVYRIWSYLIDPGSQGDLPQSFKVALALPGDLDVRSPDLYPGLQQLAGTFLLRDPQWTRQYVGRTISNPGNQTISFVAPESETTREVVLVRAPSGQQWTPLSFTTGAGGGGAGFAHKLPVPVPGPPAFNGRPLEDFAGTLPYASELFGIYQPLAGWFGAQAALWAKAGAGERAAALSLRREAFSGDAARTLNEQALAVMFADQPVPAQGVLSPVGMMNLFRQYFFEFDSFLGPPAGHLWISPGGTVEVVETNTRRTLVEKFTEQFEETTRTTEESLSQQDDVADAVKEENANDTNLGVSVTAGVNAGIYHADASASFSTNNTVKRSSEQTHKNTRTQSAKVTSELRRNFKTTFKTVTETTDTSSRRYVLQNTTDQLVNYELRRKMRKVGVQLQHIGTRLSWQVYFNTPGRELGLGDMVHVVPAPDLTAVPKPEMMAVPADKELPLSSDLPFIQTGGGGPDPEDIYQANPADPDEGIFQPFGSAANIIKFRFDIPAPAPPAGFVLSNLSKIDFHGALIQFTTDADTLNMDANPDPVTNRLTLRLTYADFQEKLSIPFDAVFVYTPDAKSKGAIEEANAAALAAYQAQVAQLEREAYGNAVRERLKLVSSVRSRPPEDLRKEERHTVFARLIRKLRKLSAGGSVLGDDPQLGAELIRQFFEVDEMLYFVAPDFWRPSDVPDEEPSEVPASPTKDSVGRYPVPPPPWAAEEPGAFAGVTVAGWYSYTEKYNAVDTPDPGADEEWRVNYLVTEETQPAPLGSSLGWLIQIDGDERRNEFLNAAWAKAVLPIRPGHEIAALKLLTEIEGEAALGLEYPMQPGDPSEYTGKTVGEVLEIEATKMQASNTNLANTLATDKVFETGFNPLDGGFRPAQPYQIFDQWIEVLPTDQIAAVQTQYNPKTGQQL